MKEQTFLACKWFCFPISTLPFQGKKINKSPSFLTPPPPYPPSFFPLLITNYIPAAAKRKKKLGGGGLSRFYLKKFNIKRRKVPTTYIAYYSGLPAIFDVVVYRLRSYANLVHHGLWYRGLSSFMYCVMNLPRRNTYHDSFENKYA